MSDILKSLKELLSFYWTPSKTPQDRIIKRYDLLIFVGVIFITIYIGHLFFSAQNADVILKPSVVTVNTSNIPLNSNISKNRVANTNISFKLDEFYIGEIVNVRDFGVYGKVIQKIFGTTGYTYEVRWKDNERGLPKDVFYPWELEKSTVPISVLQN
jgi:hypothetical protein